MPDPTFALHKTNGLMQARNSKDLIEKLTGITERNLAFGESLLALPSETLHLHIRQAQWPRPRPNAWNALECLAHLNHYGDYYLPEMRKQIAETKHKQPAKTYTSSWLGNKFAAGMKPGPQTRKIKTFKSANPINFSPTPDRSTIEEFIRQQKDLLDILALAATVDLSRTKTGISISSLIKIRLCDTLRVVIYHNWRHVEQAEKSL